MLLEVLLILPLYLVVGFLYWKFSKLLSVIINMTALVDELFSEVYDEVDKREFLKEVLSQGKKLPGKTPWSDKRLDKASGRVVEKLYAEYTQTEIQHKAENTGKAVSKHVINLYSNVVSQVLRINDLELLKRDIDEDPIIKDSMADIGALMVITFRKWLSPIFIACHTANHTQGFTTTNEKSNEEQE